MTQIQSVLITIPFPDEWMVKICAALPGAQITITDNKETEKVRAALETADTVFLAGDVNDLIMTGKNLKWVHCDHSGLTKSARPDVFERGIIVTGGAGRNGPALAEHALMFMLALNFDLPKVMGLQRAHQWGGLPGYSDRRCLMGKTAGIIGVGHTGSELAMRLKALGMRVLGYRRKDLPCEYVDRMYISDRGETVDELLQESDFVILTTQLSDATYHMIGREQFKMMKRSACLINMCRGSVVDERALIEALRSGEIAGAGVDTPEKEPLPYESETWDAPNLLLTPHSTPAVPNRWERSTELLLENIRRYRAEEPMLNQLTIRDVYTH